MEVGQFVQAQENQSINLIIYRNTNNTNTTTNNEEIISLALTPQRWSGPGLLGCHIVPL